MQLILKRPTTSIQIAPSTSGSEASHKHRQHHSFLRSSFNALQEESKGN
jgi:hypothetical protein